MRFASLLVLGVLLAAPAVAQQSMPAPAPESLSPGPVVAGKHRQPTESEIESRENAEGTSPQAIQEKNQRDLKALDDIYRELEAGTPPANPQSTK